LETLTKLALPEGLMSITVGRMTKGCLAVLKRALQDIIELPQPDGHDCDDDQVIELLADMIEKEEEKEE
jgi:hypothetical protein